MEHRDSPASTSQALELKMCATIPSTVFTIFLLLTVFMGFHFKRYKDMGAAFFLPTFRVPICKK